MKFKVGDRVRVCNIPDRRPWLKQYDGKTATVKKAYKCANPDNGCYDIGVDHIFPEDCLELVQSAFKVGDKVKIVAANHCQTFCKDCIGGVYTIMEVNNHGHSYRVNTPHHDVYWWNDSELELVEEKKPEPKFKVGDKVRVRYIRGESVGDKKPFSGKEYLIDYIIDGAKYIYSLVGQNIHFWCDDELELVKPKFDINDYPGKYVMHVTTEDQAKIFCEYLDSVGEKWFGGQSYKDETYYSNDREETVYFFNMNTYDVLHYANIKKYTILNFEDFDWSDFMSKKEFTKKDLRDGDVVKLRSGAIRIVLLDKRCLLDKHTGGYRLDNIEDNLKHESVEEFDIMAVRRVSDPERINFGVFDNKIGELVYERKEVEEMTLAEVCKALGKEIKIIKD